MSFIRSFARVKLHVTKTDPVGHFLNDSLDRQVVAFHLYGDHVTVIVMVIDGRADLPEIGASFRGIIAQLSPTFMAAVDRIGKNDFYSATTG